MTVRRLLCAAAARQVRPIETAPRLCLCVNWVAAAAIVSAAIVQTNQSIGRLHAHHALAISQPRQPSWILASFPALPPFCSVLMATLYVLQLPPFG